MYLLLAYPAYQGINYNEPNMGADKLIDDFRNVSFDSNSESLQALVNE